jgi:4-diphosphocytidyl-2-C-methyl-D-erythritol kinase
MASSMAKPKRQPLPMNEKSWVRIFAPAKINLYLHVTGRRADGLHDLDSLVVFAGIGDDIAVSHASCIDFAVDGPFAHAVPSCPNNLVVRAAHALAELGKVTTGSKIRLTKRLPVASGIGGGSADAAAVIYALLRLWRLRPEPSRLKDMAMALGADVPVCMAGRPMFVGGAGETLIQAPPLPACWLVLANPLREVSTALVFKERQGTFSAASRFTETPANVSHLTTILQSRNNDLAAAARNILPEVGAVLDALAELPGALLSRMSGSGATGFALFSDQNEAESAAASLRKVWPEWWVAAAPVMGPSGIEEWTPTMT